MDDKDTSLIQNDEIIIDVGNILDDSISIDTTNVNSNYYYSMGSTGAVGSSAPYGNITINTSNAGFNGTWGNTVMSSSKAGLHVTSNAEFDGDVKIKGVSILETLDKIEKRLAILRPDPEKLEHFEALRKAYEHYKTLEALCEVPKKEEE